MAKERNPRPKSPPKNGRLRKASGSKTSKPSGRTRADILKAAANKEQTAAAWKAENQKIAKERQQDIKSEKKKKERRRINALDDDRKAREILDYINTLVAKKDGTPKEYRGAELPPTSNCKLDLELPNSNISSMRKPFDLKDEKHFKCAFAKWRYDHGFTPAQYPIPGYDKERTKIS